MKLEIKDIDKALNWIKSNTNAVTVQIDILGDKMYIKTVDKYEKFIEIVVHDSDTAMMPLITSTDRLR